MLAARVLSRALAAPKAAQPLAAAAAAGGPWTSILDPYAGKSISHASFAVSSATNAREDPPPGRPRGLATTPGPAGPEAGPEPAGAGGFLALSTVHATLASLCFFAPEMVANAFFPGVALPQGFQSQALVQLLGCGLAAGSASCFAVHKASEQGALASPTAQRLQLGLLGFSAAAIGTHAMYAPAITAASLGGGALAFGATGAAAYRSFAAGTGAPPRPGAALSRYFGAVPDHLRVSGLQSALFSALTPVLAAAGASYVFFPGATLAAVFGFAKDAGSFFFWQNIGGGLLTIAPAMTYSLKKEADEGRLGGPVAKTLSGGILVAALGHLAVLGPMVVAGQGGEMLPWMAGAWAAAAGAGALGLMGGGAAGAAGGAAGAGGGGAAAAGKA